MTFTDYLLDLALIGMVLIQIRGRTLTVRNLLLPVGIVVYVADRYLRAVPTAGNDLILVAGCTAIGITLGALCGHFTTVTRGGDGRPFARAGAIAAALWVLGVGTRFAFQLYTSHGGAEAVGRFSVSHGIPLATISAAWTAALILMALGEALSRTGVLALRAVRLGGLTAGPVRAAQGGAVAAGGTAWSGGVGPGAPGRLTRAAARRA